MRVDFRAVEELAPGPRWAELFRALWPSYRAYFLREGDEARPGYLSSLRALRQHMPELVSLYERLVELAGGGDAGARFLSLYRPTPYLTGCSQAVWTRGEPFLVRNYDYSPALWEGLLLHTAWHGRRVIAMSDCLWGVLDGMNEAGLSVSLAFGGRKVVGDGFGTPLVLRYVLEFCESTAEATHVLERVPVHMAYNVTVLDAQGDFRTLYLAPDHPAVVLERPFATNHQRAVEWEQHAAATGSVDRERLLDHHLGDPRETAERFADRFLEPPLFAADHARGWGTLYTAVYDPGARRAVYRWPGRACPQSFEDFSELGLALSFPG